MEARLARGEIFLRQARYGQAMDIFRKLIKQKFLLARSYQGLGVAGLLQGRRAEAKRMFIRVTLRRGFSFKAALKSAIASSYRDCISFEKPRLLNNAGLSRLSFRARL